MTTEIKIYQGASPLKAPQKVLDEMNKINATHVKFRNTSSDATFLMTKKGVENEIIQKSLASRDEKTLSAENCKNECVKVNEIREEYLYEMDMLGVDEITIKEGFGKETSYKRNS